MPMQKKESHVHAISQGLHNYYKGSHKRHDTNIKGLSVHLWRSILIFANGASYVLFSKHINMLANNVTSIILFFERTVK